MPDQDAPHFIKHDLLAAIKAAVNRAHVRGMPRKEQANTVNAALRELGFEATVKPD